MGRTGRLRVRNEFVDVEIDYALTADANDYLFETMAAEFRAPAIIFHGMADEIVPYSLSVEFANRCAVGDIELVLFKNGDHRLNREREKLAFAACEFFTSIVVSVGEPRLTGKWQTGNGKSPAPFFIFLFHIFLSAIFLSAIFLSAIFLFCNVDFLMSKMSVNLPSVFREETIPILDTLRNHHPFSYFPVCKRVV